MSNQRYLEITKRNTIAKMNQLGIDHDRFMAELSIYGGVIAGSFMFMNFGHSNGINGCNSGCPTCGHTSYLPPLNFFGVEQECGDIDVYVHDKNFLENYHDNIYKNPLNFDNAYHPFEHYIMENFAEKHVQTQSYMFVDGMVYSRVYEGEKININFVMLTEPCIPYIMNNFDLDCCKIIYDGKDVYVHKIDNLIEGKTIVRYNKCSLDNLYRGKQPYFINGNTWYPKTYPNPCTIQNSIAFLKFKILYEVYLYNYNHEEAQSENITISYYETPRSDSNHNYYQPPCPIANSNPILKDLILTEEDILTYDNYINEISKRVNLYELFKGPRKIWDKIRLTDDIVRVISMIRTLERIDKYRERGIKEFKFEEPNFNQFSREKITLFCQKHIELKEERDALQKINNELKDECDALQKINNELNKNYDNLKKEFDKLQNIYKTIKMVIE